MVRASIIIPVYNQLDYTEKCLEYVERYTDLRNNEIIIVDNASSDGTEEYFRQKKKYIYIQNNNNMGFPKAANRGIRRALGAYYVVLNNDVLVTKGWLERLIEVADSEDNIGMVGPMTN